MTHSIQFNSRVGDDGVLQVQVNLGPAEASKEVVVTIATPADADATDVSTELPWSEFVARTYGSCAGLGLERPAQGMFESREPIT